MSVYFIFGKPGGGKSLLGMQRLAAELTTGTRPVITNLPVDPGALHDHLTRTAPTYDGNALGRLRVISADEVCQWWRFRGRPGNDPLSPWVTLPEPDTGQNSRGETDFRSSPGPALYILDEVHIQFGSRTWMKTGPAALWYLSQHRKMGDDVILISQTVAQVDKQLRSLSQEYIHVSNLGKLSIGLLWAAPRRILCRSFGAEPRPGEPMLSVHARTIPTPGLADCYNTAAGNGLLAQGSADKAERRRGLPFSTLLLLPVVGLLLFAQADKAALWGLRRMDSGGVLPGAPKPAATNPAPTPEPALQPSTAPPPPEPQVLPASTDARSTNRLRVIGWWKIGQRLTACLSDGRNVSLPGEIVRFDSNQGVVLASGQTIPFL